MYYNFKIFALVVILGLVCFFSWLPSPNLRDTGLFPGKLGEWVDNHYNSRTAIPFVLLGFGLRVFFKDKRFLNSLIVISSFSLLLVIVVETGQLWLPDRHFDFEDIAWGLLGSVLGVLLFDTGRLLFSHRVR